MSGTLPSAMLHTPYPADPIPDTVEHLILNLPSLISPTHVIRTALDFVGVGDPAGEIVETFGGNWEAVSTVSSAVGQLAEYFGQLGSEIEQTRAELVDTWTGNAADAASAHFETLAVAIESLRAPLETIQENYQTLAVGVYERGQAISSLINLLCDYLIELGLALLAMAASSWTGLGALIGGGASAYLAYRATSTWIKVTTALSNAVTFSHGVIGVITSTVGAIQTEIAPALEFGAPTYQHPAVS